MFIVHNTTEDSELSVELSLEGALRVAESAFEDSAVSVYAVINGKRYELLLAEITTEAE